MFFRLCHIRHNPFPEICHIRHNSPFITSHTTFSNLYYVIYDIIYFLRYVTYDIMIFLLCHMRHNPDGPFLLAGIFELISSQGIYFNGKNSNINLYEYRSSLKVDINFYQEKSHFYTKTAHFYTRYHDFIN